MIPDRHIELWKWSQGEKLDAVAESLIETMAKITIEELLSEKYGRDGLVRQSCPQQASSPVEWSAVLLPRISAAGIISEVTYNFSASSVGQLKDRLSFVWMKMQEMVDALAEPGETIQQFGDRWRPPTVSDDEIQRLWDTGR